MSRLHWKELLGWDEDYLDDLRVTAFFYIREGQYDIARTFCETLAVLNPENAYDQQTLGALYLQNEDPSSALTYLEKARRLDPENSIVRINRIKALLMLGYREEGLNLLEDFLSDCKEEELRSDAEALQMAYRS